MKAQRYRWSVDWAKRMIMISLIVIAAFILAACGGKRIDASALIKPVVWGLNGDGRLRLEVDVDAIGAAINGDKPLTDRQIEQLNSLSSDLQKDYAISKRSELSNGDIVEITGSLKEDSFSVFGVKINNDTLKYTVSGLADVEEVQLEDYILCEAYGFDGEGSVRTEVDWEALFAMQEARSKEIGAALSEEDRQALESVYAYCDEGGSYSNGDEVTVHLGMSGTELESCGLRFVVQDIIYSVSGLAKIESVNMEDYLIVGAQGYNSMGTPLVILDREKLTSDLGETFRRDGRGFTGATSDDADYAAEAAAAAEAIDGEWKDNFGFDYEPGVDLSNGDAIQASFWSYRGELSGSLRRYGLTLTGEELSGTVQGLPEPAVFDMSRFFNCEYTGFDGAGIGEIQLDYESMREALIQMMLEQRSDVDRETAEHYLDRNGPGFNMNEGELTQLSNGDRVLLDVSLDMDRLADYGIKLIASPLELEVSGLSETQPLDLTELVTVTFEGVAPHLTAVCEFDWEKDCVHALNLSEIATRTPFIAENGDRFTMELPYDKQELLSMGYRVVNSTVSVPVRGMYSYGYSLESADEERLLPLIEMGRERAWSFALEHSSALPALLDPDRDSRILWDRAALDYAGVCLGQMDAEDRASNAMFLIYRFAAPVRYMNQEAAVKTCWIEVSAWNVLLNPEDVLTTDEPWGVEWYGDQAVLDAFINQWMADNLGEGHVLTRMDTDAELTQPKLPEAAQTVGREPGTAGDGRRIALVDVMPSYAANTSVVDTVTDPYGTEHLRSMAFNVDERAKAEYELNGRYSVFSGTMSTFNEANTNARMSLYIWGDGTLLFRSDGYQRAVAPIPFTLDVTGVRLLSIQTRNIGEKGSAWLYINEGQLEAAEATEAGCEFYGYNELFAAYTNATENRRGKGLVMNMYNEVCRDLMNLHSWENGAHAISLNGQFAAFRAKVLIWNDDKDARAQANLSLLADGREVWRKDGLTPLDGIQHIELDLTGVNLLEWRSSTDSETGIPAMIEIYDTEFDKLPPETAPAAIPERGYATMLSDVEIGGSVSTGNYRYVLVNIPSTLPEALQAAEAAGGSLAMPKTGKAMRAVSWLVSNCHADCDGYWLGASNMGLSGWQWHDGTPMNSDNGPWSRNQPDNYQDREYLLGSFTDGTWNDYADDVSLGYVLEFPLVSGIAEEGAFLGVFEPIQLDRAEIGTVLFEDGERMDPYGIWLDANRNGSVTFELGGDYETLSGSIIPAFDASVNARGLLAVFGDGRLLWQAPELKHCDEGFHFEIDVTGVSALTFQTGEFATDDEFRVVVCDAMLTPAPRQALNGDVNVLNADAIDLADAERQWGIFGDSYEGLHQGGMILNAGRGGHVMYNISGHRVLTGTLCGGWGTLESEDSVVRVLVDGQEVLCADGFSLLSMPMPFELDIEGATTVEFIAESQSQADNRVYICDLIAN